MVRIPSLSRRTAPAPTRDENLDGRNRTDDTGRVDRPVVSHRDDEQAYRSGATTGADDRAGDAERTAVTPTATVRTVDDHPRRPEADPMLERTLEGRTTDLDRDGTAARAVAMDRDRPVDRDGDGVDDRLERRTVVGPRPRASLLATLGLIAGLAGALFVLTGALAGYGIGLGAVGAVLAVLGLVATRRRHIAGKTDALLGVAFGLGAVVLGVLAMTGQFDWPTTDGEWVSRFREWLDSQFADRF